MLSEKKLFLLDIDGTVCKGGQLISGTREFLRDIKESGGMFVFITNNATKSIADYIRMFQQFGIAVEYANFVTASYAAVRYLKRHHTGELVYVMGTRSFCRELKREGIQITDDWEDDGISVALVSYDNQLTYQKISDTCRVLMNPKVTYLATNPDFVCPVEFGCVPDCGSICEMLAHSVKRKPYFIGKPETAMVECALRQNHFAREETLIVGDRLYTDILCGYKAGVETALVLTGEATKEEALRFEVKPNYIVSSISELHKMWK